MAPLQFSQQPRRRSGRATLRRRQRTSCVSAYPARERKLGFEWTNPARDERIHGVLGSLPKVSLGDSERLQSDVLSLPARRLTLLFASLVFADEKTLRAPAFPGGRDARLSVDSPQAALEAIWQLRDLRKANGDAVLPPELAAAMPTTDMKGMLAGLEAPDARFNEYAAAKPDQLLLCGLSTTWEEMEVLQGPDPSRWPWGKLHFNLNEHPFAPIVDDATRRGSVSM